MTEVIISSSDSGDDQSTDDATAMKVGEHEARLDAMEEKLEETQSEAEGAALASEAALNVAATSAPSEHDHSGFVTVEHLREHESRLLTRLDELVGPKEQATPPVVKVETTPDDPPKSREKTAKKKKSFSDRFYGRS